MENKKLTNQISTIHRALGMIEGVSCGLEQSAADALEYAVRMIDDAMEVIMEKLCGKAEERSDNHEQAE